MIYVFDLDGTCVDSSHRLGRGSLESWKRNNTPANVAKDKPTVLAEMLRHKKRTGHTVIVCTSRVLGQADIDWLTRHNMTPHAILSRNSESDTRSCPQLKLDKLRMQARFMGLSWDEFTSQAVMVDDHDGVLMAMASYGMQTLDAKRWVA